MGSSEPIFEPASPRTHVPGSRVHKKDGESREVGAQEHFSGEPRRSFSPVMLHRTVHKSRH